MGNSAHLEAANQRLARLREQHKQQAKGRRRRGGGFYTGTRSTTDDVDRSAHLPASQPSPRNESPPEQVDREPDTSVESPHVSFSNSVYQNPHTTLPIHAFYQYVQAGRWRHQIDAIRFGVGKKERLPAIKVSGVFEGGKSTQHLTSHSGRIQIDIDADGLPVDMSPEQCKALLATDPYIEFAAISPSETGAKAVAKIPTNDHGGSFRALAAYLSNEYGITIDASTKDVSRWCYVTYDPTAHINLNSKLFAEQLPAATPKQLAQLSQHLPSIDAPPSTLISYVDAVIKGEIAKVSSAATGTRNRTTLNAALRLFSLTKSPQLEHAANYNKIVDVLSRAWWQTHQDTAANRKELEKLLAWTWDKAKPRLNLKLPTTERVRMPTLNIICQNKNVADWRCDKPSCKQCENMRAVKLIGALKVEEENGKLFIHRTSQNTYAKTIAASRQRISRKGKKLCYMSLPQADHVLIIHNDKTIGGDSVGNAAEMFEYLQDVDLWSADDSRHSRSRNFGGDWSQLYKGDGRTENKRTHASLDALIQEIDAGLYEIAAAKVIAPNQISITVVDLITLQKREEVYSVNIHYSPHEIGSTLPDLYIRQNKGCKCKKCRLYQNLFGVQAIPPDLPLEDAEIPF